VGRVAFGSTLGQSLGNGRFNTTATGAATAIFLTTAADDAVGTASGALATDVDAAVGVLVADGATPTEAHVTTLATAWSLLATAIADAKTATAAAKALAAPADAILDVNPAVLTTQNGVRAVLRNIEKQLAGFSQT
jgi:hypothetical protein